MSIEREALVADIERARTLQAPEERALIIKQLASQPEQTLPMLIELLQGGAKGSWAVAIDAVAQIGYPHNAMAIPVLIRHLEDINDPAWADAAYALDRMGPEAVVPHLIKRLAECIQGLRAHTTPHPDWGFWLEGLCSMLAMPTIDVSFAVQCGPILNYLLAGPASSDELDKNVVLEVFARIPPIGRVYVIPSLIFLLDTSTDEVRANADGLLRSFDMKLLSAYQPLLSTIRS